MLTADQIAKGKAITAYSSEPHHEHDDCIRIAYAWLDAQAKQKTPTRVLRPLKHIIEKWAGRYVSASDVEVAATLHPQVRGAYPYFNIKAGRLVEPAVRRLAGIGEANTQGYRERHDAQAYATTEV